MREELRRRALDAELPEWDYEWDASKGLLTANDNGWTQTIVGAGGYAPVIVDDYLQLRGSSVNYKYFDYKNTYSTGVMETEINAYSSNARIQVSFSTGSHSITINLRTYGTRGIYLGTGTTTMLQSASNARKYKVRLVLKPGLLGDVYIDDVLRGEDVDVSSDSIPNIRILHSSSGSGNQYVRIYSVKMKFNRI